MTNKPTHDDAHAFAATVLKQTRHTDSLFSIKTGPIRAKEYRVYDNRRPYGGPVTKEPKTIIAYFRFIHNQTQSNNVSDLISELLGSRDMCRSTFNKKRAAYCYFLEYAMENGLNAPHALNLYKSLKSFNSCQLPSKGKLTCSKRRKSVNQKDHKALADYFYSRKTHYADLTAQLHCSNIYWGLRLCEWESAGFEKKDGKRVLRVRNAKQSNGRANGTHRFIGCEHYDPNILQLTAECINTYQQHLLTASNKTIMGGVGREYLKANKALFPKRKTKVTYYSTRHQFSANYKAWSKQNSELGEEYDERKLPALMGQGSSVTPHRHYGKAYKGWEGSGSWGPHTMPEPSAENLANVKDHGFVNRRIGIEVDDGPSLSF